MSINMQGNMTQTTIKKKKIVLISNELWNIVNFRKGIIDALITSNYQVHVITRLQNDHKIQLNNEVFYYNIDIDRRGINLIKEISLFINLYKIIKKIDPHILLNYTIKPVIYASLVSRYLNIKNINTITGLGRVFIVKKLFILKFLIIFLYKTALKNSLINYFHNNDDLNYFIKKKITNRSNSAVTNGSGINIDKFNYYFPIFKSKITFLTISRLTAEKGIYDLIEAIRLINKKNLNIEFVIIGGLEKNSQGGITLAKIKEWEKERLIIYRGFVDNVKNIIVDCDALILPSHREGLSRSIQESMSVGRPVIGSNCTGNKDIIKTGYNGYLFKIKNSRDLSNKILKFCNLSKDDRIKFSQNARETAKRLFDENKIINEYLKVIDNQ